MLSGRSSDCHTMLSIFESFWWDGTRISILMQVRNWSLQMSPPLPLLQAPRRKSGPDWFDFGSGSWGIACTLKGLVKIPFRILSPLWKLEWVKTASKLIPKSWLHDGWDCVAEADRIRRIWHDKKFGMQINSLNVVGIWIWDGSASSSINRDDPGSSRLIFSRVLCPPKFLFWWIAMSLFFFVRWRKERERMEMVDASH